MSIELPHVVRHIEFVGLIKLGCHCSDVFRHITCRWLTLCSTPRNFADTLDKIDDRSMRIQSNILNRRNTVMTTKPWNGDDTSWKFEQGPENVFGVLISTGIQRSKDTIGRKITKPIHRKRGQQRGGNLMVTVF